MNCWCVRAQGPALGLLRGCTSFTRNLPRHLHNTAQPTHSSPASRQPPPPPPAACPVPVRCRVVPPGGADTGPLTSLFARLCMTGLVAGPVAGPVAEYRLPVWRGSGGRVRDPCPNPRVFQLPTLTQVEVEKVSPGVGGESELWAPDPAGGAATPLLLMPWLMRIRHKKMKKHKLRKFRKRMIFVHRKQTIAKNKKKEKVFREWEKALMRDAEAFDPDAFIAGRLAEARRGGWGVDVFAADTQGKRR